LVDCLFTVYCTPENKSGSNHEFANYDEGSSTLDDGSSALEEEVTNAISSTSSPWHCTKSRDTEDIGVFKMFRQRTFLTKNQFESIGVSRGALYESLQRFVHEPMIRQVGMYDISEDDLDLARWYSPHKQTSGMGSMERSTGSGYFQWQAHAQAQAEARVQAEDVQLVSFQRRKMRVRGCVEMNEAQKIRHEKAKADALAAQVEAKAKAESKLEAQKIRHEKIPYPPSRMPMALAVALAQPSRAQVEALREAKAVNDRAKAQPKAANTTATKEQRKAAIAYANR